MSRTQRARYGVDGYPYLLGLGTASVVLVLVGVFGVVRQTGRQKVSAVVALLVGGGAAVPAFLGLRYVVSGKTALRDRVLDAVDWSGDEVVVDLGSGAGLLGIGAAKRTSGVVHCVDLFIGKDLSGNSSRRLERNADIEGVRARIVLHENDVRHLALADDSADVVVSALCLHNIDDAAGRHAAIVEAARVVRPGGTIVLSDLAHVDAEYAPGLRTLGFEVGPTARVPATFPPQRMVVARRRRPDASIGSTT